ncbi:malto-oligosyltrehalose synthase [Rhodococcus aerolatus]
MPVLSTYRLQLHGPGEDGVPAFTLADATALLDQLQDLGVSHVYCSPVLQASAGSQHGYDVVDPTAVSAELGGPEALAALGAAAHERGMGVVVDIVPNHVGVAVPAENGWWWDLLTHGADSPYARYFDVDLAPDNGCGGRIALPVLGSDDDVAELELRTGGPGGEETVLAYYEHEYPVAPGTGEGTAQEVHDRQAYQLVSWRAGLVGYRRFFTVSDLAALRQEDGAVFDAAHVEVARWAQEGLVDGIRVDHPDGLADPLDYLTRLRGVLGPDRWLVVEKILGADEELDAALPVAGTTGYDALREVGGVLVDPAGEAPLTAWCRARAGDGFDAASLEEAERELKRSVVLDGLRPELERLTRAVAAVAPGAGHEELVAALAEVVAVNPLYRSDYPSLGAVLPAALARVAADRPDLETALGHVAAALAAGDEAATRFQQVCGAATAKGVEDCLFYRANRLLTLQEVGGAPGRFGMSPAEAHLRAGRRATAWPAAMTTLSTHDTKRGEDVRARIGVLSQVAERWTAAVDGWEATAPTPDPATGFLLWQTVLGVWPADDSAPDPTVVARLHAYAEKAVREAGTRTGWNDVDEDFETAVHTWIDAVCTGPVAAELGALVAELAPHGWSDSLAQKLLQLAGPGVPDVYQGTELWEDSLVDPDNRREVDHAHRRELLAGLDDWAPQVDASGRAKLLVVRESLRLRRERPASFVGGAYLPLLAEGRSARHVVAFARGAEAAEPDVVAVATRLSVRLDGWAGTTLALPAGTWTDRLTGTTHEGTVDLGDLLERLPVALLERG